MPADGPDGTGDGLSVASVVVVRRTFPARPGALPDAEAFVRDLVDPAGLEPAERGALYTAITTALLAAAGPSNGSFEVTVRMLPDSVEVEVLHGTSLRRDEAAARLTTAEPFASWLAGALLRHGLSQQAAADQAGVSVRTVSRWLRGDTEPRLRDLRRVQEMFGN